MRERQLIVNDILEQVRIKHRIDNYLTIVMFIINVTIDILMKEIYQNKEFDLN